MDQVFIIVLAVLVGCGLAYAAYVQAQKRREALWDVARHLGLRFDPEADTSLHRVFGHSLFTRGRSRKATNNISGALTLAGQRVEVRMADYQYVTGSGKNRQVHRLSFACFRLPFVGTPDLVVRKEHLGDKLLGGLGFDDIDFESDEFSRAFFVKSRDRRYAYDLIHPRMMEYFLKGPTPQIEIVLDACLIQEGRRRWDPAAFLGAVRWFEGFLELWPEHLVDQLQPRRGGIL